MHDKVNWENKPRGAMWWAVDKNGAAHWFVEPDIKPFTDFWFSEPIRAPDFDFNGNWRESLTSRAS